MKQRNLNELRSQNSADNPFSKSNPYRLKARFYSQKKSSTTQNKITVASSNPQSLKYKRNYKQNPPMFDCQQLRDNFMEVKNNVLIRKKLNCFQQSLEKQDYRLRLRRFVADKFCPSDPYLQIVKDKFAYVSNDQNSQFQNVIKMSNLGISRFTVKNNETLSDAGSYAHRHKQNPFYRKNLISSSTEHTNIAYQSQYYSSKVDFSLNADRNEVSAYQYNDGIYHSVSSSSHYQFSAINPNEMTYPNYNRSQKNESNISDYIMERIATAAENHNDNYSVKQSANSLEASFGPDYPWKEKGHKNFSYLDAVIEHQLQDPLKIQSKAPKSIKIKGKPFFFNRVSRLTT